MTDINKEDNKMDNTYYIVRCTRCGRTPDVETPFCAWCGAPMTDEAVQMVMERIEALHETD